MSAGDRAASDGYLACLSVGLSCPGNGEWVSNRWKNSSRSQLAADDRLSSIEQRTLKCCAVFRGSREGNAVAENALKLTGKGHGSGREIDGSGEACGRRGTFPVSAPAPVEIYTRDRVNKPGSFELFLGKMLAHAPDDLRTLQETGTALVASPVLSGPQSWSH